MGSPEFMAAWDEMCLKCAEHDAMTAAGIVVGEDGAVRWHGLTGAEIAQFLYLLHEARDAVPFGSDLYNEIIDTLAAAAGRGADGEATQ